MRYRLALPVAALALVAIASNARAQAPAATATATASSATAATPWTAKSAGTFDIVVTGTGSDDHTESATLIIGADSTGALTAKVVEGPHNDEHPMAVEVKGADLVMKSQTNNGVMTITVQRHGDALTGHWEIGMQQGTLTGKLHS